MAPGSNRLFSLAAAVGSLALLAAVIFMLWPADPSDTAGLDQVDGETVGWVSKVEANTIHVNSGPFGSGVIPLLITRNTKITVGSKEGWFEDIRPGGQVKVVYQIAHGKRLARSVELLVDEGLRRPTRLEPRVKSATGGEAAEPVRTKAAAGGRSGLPEARAPEAPGATPSTSARPSSAPVSPPSEARTPARADTPRVQAVEPAVARTPSTGGRASGPAESGGRAPDTARPQPVVAQPAPVAARSTAEPARVPAQAPEGESADGAAAVDWLLKSRR